MVILTMNFKLKDEKVGIDLIKELANLALDSDECLLFELCKNGDNFLLYSSFLNEKSLEIHQNDKKIKNLYDKLNEILIDKNIKKYKNIELF